jgi:arylsulfatase
VAPPVTASAPTRPNILWICTDQQRWDTVGALGNPSVRTPTLDQLVAESVAFTHAYCQSPICTPSRASFLTGLYPSTIHASMNGNDYWAEAAPLITKLLADAGYDCGLVGKFHLSATSGRIERRPADDGYRIFEWSHDPRDRWPEGHAYKEWLAAQGHDLGEMRRDPGSIPPALHQTTWCADVTIQFIEEHAPAEAGGTSERAGQPWLMSFNCFDPHPPFDPPREYMAHFDLDEMPAPLFRESDLAHQQELAPVVFQSTAQPPEAIDAKRVKAAYYAMIELIDDNLRRMLDALERTGQRENTIIIFTSDHGEALGDHGLLQKGCRLYDGLTRVPLILSWPGHFSAGLRSEALVELLDIVPTLLDVIALPYPPRMHGRSLLPILRGDADPGHHRDFVRSEFYQALGGPIRNRFSVEHATMVRDRRHKLVVYHGHEPGELFDLQDDPGEFVNLWADPAYADIRHALMKRCLDLVALSIDTGPMQVAGS